MQFQYTLYKIRTLWLRFAWARIVLKRCLRINVQSGISISRRLTSGTDKRIYVYSIGIWVAGIQVHKTYTYSLYPHRRSISCACILGTMDRWIDGWDPSSRFSTSWQNQASSHGNLRTNEREKNFLTQVAIPYSSLFVTFSIGQCATAGYPCCGSFS